MSVEWHGAWGISSCGVIRHAVGKCDRCAAAGKLYRVFRDQAYRGYVPGQYCLGCARIYAQSCHVKDEERHRAQVAAEWEGII